MIINEFKKLYNDSKGSQNGTECQKVELSNFVSQKQKRYWSPLKYKQQIYYILESYPLRG